MPVVYLETVARGHVESNLASNQELRLVCVCVLVVFVCVSLYISIRLRWTLIIYRLTESEEKKQSKDEEIVFSRKDFPSALPLFSVG